MKISAKRVLALLLTLLIAASSFGVSAFADDDELKMSVTVQMLKKSGDEWVESKTVLPGESVKVRVYIGTDFAAGSGADLLFFYSRDFFSDSYENGDTLKSINPIYKGAPYRYELNIFSDVAKYRTDLLQYKQITAAQDAAYCCLHTMVTGIGTSPAKLSGENWFCEYDLTVNNDAEGTGFFRVIPSTIGSTENFYGRFDITNSSDYSMTLWSDEWDPYEDVELTNGYMTVEDDDAPEEVTVTFSANGGKFADNTDSVSTKCAYNEPVSVPASPVNSPAEFSGWYNAADPSETIVDPDEMVAAEDIVYKAKWYCTETYKAIFVVDDEGIANNDVPFGSTIPVPDDPEKEGMVFAGWEPAVPATMPRENCRFVAKFDPIKQKADLVVDGEVIGTVDYVPGSGEIELPEVPEKEGYEGRWSYDLNADPVVVEAVYDPITYYADFKANGEKVDSVPYTVETDSITPPEVPDYYGVPGKWESWSLPIGGTTINAVYPTVTRKITWIVDGVSTTDEVIVGSDIVKPESPEKPGFDFGGWTPDVPEKMTNTDFTFTAILTPKTFTVYITVDGQRIGETQYTYGDTELDLSAFPVPEKEGHTGEWSYTLTENGAEVIAVYTPITYTVTWVTDGKESKIPVTFGEKIEKPADPEKPGFDFGGWTPAVPETMPAADQTFTANFIPKTFTVDITVDGKKIGETQYTYGDTELDLSAFPVPEKEGHTGEWSYTLTENGAEVTAVYTAITYYAVFIADGAEIARIPYTVETASITAPAVPAKAGYNGCWSNYTLTIGGITVNAVYEKAAEGKLAIHRMDMYNNKQVNYKSTITFYADAENVEGIEWFVNGSKVASNPDGSCTVKTAKADFTVFCQAKDASGAAVKSETEKVLVKHGFFNKLVAFFKLLFNKNAYTIYQK